MGSEAQGWWPRWVPGSLTLCQVLILRPTQLNGSRNRGQSPPSWDIWKLRAAARVSGMGQRQQELEKKHLADA